MPAKPLAVGWRPAILAAALFASLPSAALAGCSGRSDPPVETSSAIEGRASAATGDSPQETDTMSDHDTSAGEHPARGEPNRLAGESSPYLLLHKDNPVDWYPWGEEALARAREEQKPIFLSVGYSTCYWCHVMERESFSDPEIAELLNRHFIAIKVDREERPDLDEIYMAATQLLTQHGGWPNSVFLTPELKPFYAGTYFPPRDRYGRPGFASLLVSLADAWKGRRGDVKQHADELAGAMKRYLEDRVRPGEAPPDPAVAERAYERLAARYDRTWGGFGSAPKFPTPSNLYLLAELAGGEPRAAEMLTGTLDQMARGGIYDQLAGGFHRYATDEKWRVPHFEKMLYDNGFLLDLYAREAARTGDPEMARVASEISGFLEREMTGAHGALLSAIDAETDGEEGAYYVWTRGELEAALGGEDAVFLAPLLGFDGAPFFEGDHYVLHLPRPLARQAADRRMELADLVAEIGALEARLLAERDRRDRPATDDKVLTDWNGIAIHGLATAGRLLDDPALVERAAKAARFLLAEMRSDDGVLLHVWRAGVGKIDAYLADYAFLVRGLLALDDATGGDDRTWLETAAALTDEQIRRLAADDGGFYVAAESPDLLFRSKDVFDGALPSANAVAVLNLLELAERTGEARWRDEARSALAAFAPLVEQFPEGSAMLTIAARRFAVTTGAEAGEETAGSSASRRPRQPSLQEELADEARRVVATGLELEPAADGRSAFAVTLTILDGWHVNAHPAGNDRLIATEVRGVDGAEVSEVAYPEARRLELGFADEPIPVYAGRVVVRGEVAGEGALELTYQACDDSRCLPPVTVRLPF